MHGALDARRTRCCREVPLGRLECCPWIYLDATDIKYVHVYLYITKYFMVDVVVEAGGWRLEKDIL